MAIPQDPQERVAPLLDLDPDLGEHLTDERLEEARRTLLVRVRRLPAGVWDADRLAVRDSGHLGLLVLDGVLMRETLNEDVASSELIGPGDVLRPWTLGDEASLLRVRARWSVLSDARVAVLDRRLAQQLGGFPELTSLLIERMNARVQRLAVAQAISQLNRVDDRVLSILWHLAERWGRMTLDGVALPLTLSHRLLAQLIGARRPTVSTALGQLAARGEVVRLPGGSWLLKGTPPGQPDDALERFIPPRRRFIAAQRDEPDRVPPPELAERLAPVIAQPG